MKYYAVRSGRTTGIFTTWRECEASVKGFPCAGYKSFTSKKDAEAFLLGGAETLPPADPDGSSDGGAAPGVNAAVAYTDGTYDVRTKRYGYGAVIIDADGGEFTLYGGGNDARYASARNVAGEVLAALAAIDWALDNNRDALEIHHDYEGVAKWPSGEWKANTPVSVFYSDTYKQKLADNRNLRVTFVKVKGHSGDKYNDVADGLAKKGAGLTVDS